jgi:hypothetical protein
MSIQQEHEYAVLGGVNRAQIGRYLSLASAVVSGWLVFLLLAAVNISKQYGLDANIPPTVLSLVGAGAVFSILYWLLNKYAWRWPAISMFLKVPNIGGVWGCKGRSLNPDGSLNVEWDAEVTIVQSWDKLRIRLKTEASGSNSMAAALTHDSADGYILLYQYRNDPKIGRTDLSSHIGCAVVTISKDLKSASAEYFNGAGRMSFGEMRWTRGA